MRRVALVAVVLAAAAALALTSLGAGEDSERGRYQVELDNAFGLIEGADVKVAGVRAGSIEGFEIDEKSYRAIVDIKIDKQGFGDLRRDVFCESRPQSLIGEYFLDCLPGVAREKLPPGARIPVEQTGSTISVDLVNNIMRRPYRERFSILLGELGAALAARGEDLNETIRRANPALREVDKVLAALADQRKVIRDLATDAERVVGRLADKRTEVTRFVAEAGDTATASAERADGIRAQLQRFPTFLRELRPTMALLGEAADRQTPALRNLASAAPLLERFFDDLGPFSDASRPATRTLAGAAEVGRGAVRSGTPRVRELQDFAKDLPELSSNLALTLEHLDDRAFAVEKDPRSPGGQGYTGFEAILQYVFRQSQATNVFDGNSYLLKVSAFLDKLCADYTDAATARKEENKRCRANLGPTQPGVDQPDFTARDGKRSRQRSRDRGDRDERDGDTGAQAPQGGGGGGSGDGGGGGGETTPPGQAPGLPSTEEIQEALDEILPDAPDLPGLGGLGGGGREPDPTGPLMDFLFGS